MDAARFLDEFRPFQRGEIAIARRLLEDPLLLPPAELDVLRYAIRLAGLPTIGEEPDLLVDRIGSFRLRLLQLLAPVLPTDPSRIAGHDLYDLIPKVVYLVDGARREILEADLFPIADLDAEIAHKRLVLVLGGAAGSGYIFLGALQRLEEMGIEPAYLVGCSIGSLLAVFRARTRRFDLEQLFEEIRRLRLNAVFRPPAPVARFGLPAALRLDLRRALGDLFTRPDGGQVRLCDLAIPMDALATGLGPGALGRSREEYARGVDVRLENVAGGARLGGGALARLVSGLVSLAMSRRVLVPVFFGADPETAELPALDAAGFSAAIPMLLHYDLAPDESEGAGILEGVFKRDEIVALVDGALVSVLPARYAWEAIQGGRIGTRHCTIVALDAMASARGANALLAPVQRVMSATAHRDRPFWDLRVPFRRTPPLLELFPPERRLRRAVENGKREFEETARLLQVLLAPLPPWRELRSRVESWG